MTCAKRDTAIANYDNCQTAVTRSPPKCARKSVINIVSRDEDDGGGGAAGIWPSRTRLLQHAAFVLRLNDDDVTISKEQINTHGHLRESVSGDDDDVRGL